MIKVLVTNDDGIDSPGLIQLAEKLSELAEVYVVAPADQQSAKSQSITFLREIHAEEREAEGAKRAWTVDGTPTDCVKWALGRLEEDGVRPDFVFSGINLGANLGLAAYYSGTIGAAREGALNGVRSIALSVGRYESDAISFDYVLGMLPRFMELSKKLSPSTIVSVNAPDLPSWKIKGLRIVPAAPFGYGEAYEFVHAGGPAYQMKSRKIPADGSMRYDFDWMAEGYAVASPLPTSIADPVALMRLRNEIQERECLAVIVDAQEAVLDIVRKPEKFAAGTERFARCIARMNLPMIITETYGQGKTISGVAKYSAEAELVERTVPDAWASPDMENKVTALGPDRVYIAGAPANTAVRKTALGFLERGYEVTVAKDCCAATSRRERRMAMEELKEAGCRIATSETVLMELAEGCSRQVLDAVKNIVYSLTPDGD